MAQHVYHWKHGWIPLTHSAAMSKAKGNPDRAAALLRDAHSPEAGIHNRRHVAKALVDLPKIENASDHHGAMQQVKAAAEAHGATDLLPGHKPTIGRSSAELEAAAKAKREQADRAAGGAGFGDSAAGRLSGPGLKQFHKSTDASLKRYTEAQQSARDLEHKAALARAREAEAARTRLTVDDLKGATHVKDQFGWHEVVRVNGKTVTVKTPYSWTDTIKHDKIHAVHTQPSVSSSTSGDLTGANKPTQSEMDEAWTLYGGGRERYIQLRAAGVPHRKALKQAADEFGRKP